MSQGGNTSGVFDNVAVVGDTLMARWAGEGRDSVRELFKKHPLKKDEVILAL